MVEPDVAVNMTLYVPAGVGPLLLEPPPPPQETIGSSMSTVISGQTYLRRLRPATRAKANIDPKPDQSSGLDSFLAVVLAVVVMPTEKNSRVPEASPNCVPNPSASTLKPAPCGNPVQLRVIGPEN